MTFADLPSEEKIKILALLDDATARSLYDKGQCTILDLASSRYTAVLLNVEEKIKKDAEDETVGYFTDDEDRLMRSHIAFHQYCVIAEAEYFEQNKPIKGPEKLYADFINK
jgi:hypothetical protein